jgi:molecular chaperone DnaK (HSP70)
MADTELMVVVDADPDAGSKGIWDQTDAKLRKAMAVGMEELSTRLCDLAMGLSTAFDRLAGSTGSFGLDALEVTAEFTARGELRLIGSVGSDVRGGFLQNFECAGGFYDINISITRGLFRALVKDLDDRLRDSIDLALRDSRLSGDRIDRIFLAGQGAKIFCVRELLEQRFVGIPLEDSFQENAVAFGIGRYSGVLTGVVKDRILLEALPFAIGVRCSRNIPEAERTSRAESEISSDRAKNTILTLLLGSHTTIPTRKAEYFRLDAAPGCAIPIDLVERDVTGRIETPIATVDVTVGVGIPEVLCTIDVDADRTLGCLVENLSTGSSSRYQLNNFFAELRGEKRQEVVRLR